MESISLVQYLKKGATNINKDQKNFKLWENGQLSTEALLDRVCENNGVPTVIKERINLRLFEEWVKSLGY